MLLTTKQRNIAIEDLNKKIRLENMLQRELQPFFNRMNKDYATVYARTGRIIDFKRYTGDLIFILRKHYTRTQRAFSGSVAAQNEKIFYNLNIKQDVDKELIALGLIEWQDAQLETQPDEILETTDKNARRSILHAQRQLTDEGADVTFAAVALTAAAVNRRSLFGRLTGIKVTETQTAAESTRLIEAEVLSGRLPFTLSPQSLTPDPFALTRPRDQDVKQGSKSWVTVGDGKVRLSHISADRQTVDIDKSFIIGGFNMRHPADLTLGAPIKEVVNCRCSSNMQIEGF
tara:strand:- start:1670 stop:2533 length:864 start_codon:yes stop_codon:yes gene_type:complete